MELYDNFMQIVALCGFDGDGIRRVVSICTPDEVEKTTQVIFEAYTSVQIIGQYALHIRSHEQARYTREEVSTTTQSK